MTFTLHPSLQAKTVVIDLPLSTVLLEDEQHYPWIMLVPRRPHILRMMDLSLEDQHQLTSELDCAQHVLWNLFSPTQLNVAAIGNRTPQLHVHVIARHSSDPAWPATVWDHPVRQPYLVEQKNLVIAQLTEAFKSIMLDVATA